MDTQSKPQTIPGRAVSSARSTDDLRRSRESLILRCQRIIFSAYRADQYSDPEGYMASLGAVLEQYEDKVIVYVTDPRSGVQRGCKWPPTIAEIVSACDAHAAHLARLEGFKNWGKPQEGPLPEPDENRLTLEQLKEKYGPNWGLSSLDERRDATPAPSWDQIVDIYRADPSRTARLMRRDPVS